MVIYHDRECIDQSNRDSIIQGKQIQEFDGLFISFNVHFSLVSLWQCWRQMRRFHHCKDTPFPGLTQEAGLQVVAPHGLEKCHIPNRFCFIRFI